MNISRGLRSFLMVTIALAQLDGYSAELLVYNNSDNGAGSLRQAVLNNHALSCHRAPEIREFCFTAESWPELSDLVSALDWMRAGSIKSSTQPIRPSLLCSPSVRPTGWAQPSV
jgi:hypothetical protein